MIVLAVVVAIALAIVAGLVAFTAILARLAERTVPPLGRWIDVDGNRIHYVDVGSGPPIVMIHGLEGQLQHFTYGIADRLKDEFRLVIVDRPGSGYSTRAAGASAALRAQAEVLAKAIECLGLERPTIAGHSMGGAVALAIALDRPELAGALALLAPLTHPVKAAPAPFQRLVIPSPLRRRIVAWTIAAPRALRHAKRTLAQVFEPDVAPGDFAVRAGGILGLRPSTFEAASADLIESNRDLRGMAKRYAELAVPLDILHGRQDPIVEFERHALPMQTAVPNATVEAIDAGHMLPIVDAERSAAFIAAVARRTANASR